MTLYANKKDLKTILNEKQLMKNTVKQNITQNKILKISKQNEERSNYLKPFYISLLVDIIYLYLFIRTIRLLSQKIQNDR